VCLYIHSGAGPAADELTLIRAVSNTLHNAATQCNALQHTALHGNTLQRTALLYNALQRTATHIVSALLAGDTAPHCNTLHHTATRYTTLQHAAPHCNMLCHTAAHYDTLKRTAAHCTYCNTLQHVSYVLYLLQILKELLHHTATRYTTLQHLFVADTERSARTRAAGVSYWCVCVCLSVYVHVRVVECTYARACRFEWQDSPAIFRYIYIQ